MKKLFAIVFIFLFSFCPKKEKKTYPRLIIAETKNIMHVNAKYMLHMSTDSGHRILATNLDSDTTFIQKKFASYPEEKYALHIQGVDTILPRYNFKIIIDTSYTFGSKGFEYKNIAIPQKIWTPDGMINGKKPTEEQIEKSSQLIRNYYNSIFTLWNDKVECYPLLIYNVSNKSAYHSYIKIIQQAKDIDGKWKPIEFFSNAPSCIPLQLIYKDFPKKYTAISIIKYRGNFKTKLRAKVMIDRHVYYSNAIDGNINTTQFDRGVARKTLETWFSNRQKDFFDYYMPYVFLENKPDIQ